MQIIPRIQKQSFGEKVSRGIGRGLEMGSQMMQQRQVHQQMQQENEAIKKLTGIDPTGINDPKMRQDLLATALQGQSQQGQQSKKQDFLNQLFGGKGNPQIENSEMTQQKGIISNKSESQQFDPSQISDEDILRAASVDPVLARELRSAKDTRLKEIQEEKKLNFQREKMGRKEETEISKPILLEMNDVRKNIPLQEQAILDIQEASPEVGALDYFADITGFEPLRTASGAKLKTGIKDFFLSDLTRAGARPNQWIEQQLADALPKIGRSPEANLITSEGLRFKVDLAKKRLELTDRISEEDREKYGFVKANIGTRTDTEMKKFVIDRQKELKERIQKIKKEYKEGSVKKGTKLNAEKALEFMGKFKGDRKKAEQHARELGYEF